MSFIDDRLMVRTKQADAQARRRQAILTAIAPYFAQLNPAREAMARLTVQFMAGDQVSQDMIASIERVTNLAAAVRRGFEQAVRNLPPDLQTNSYVADVRKAIAQVENQVAGLARQIEHGKR
jgi:hypothetical protein